MKGKKKKKKAIVEITSTTPAALIQSAVAGGADLEKLEKLLDLQLRWEANEAKKAYVLAMAAFQADPPVIEKDKHVKFETSKGTVEYDHATLANVTSKINNALSKHGLSAGWKTSQDETRISVTCKITHVMGHSEETTLKSAADLTGGKNAIQAIGSAVSYLQRYTLLSLTGLATFDMDDDGKSSEQIEQKKGETAKDKKKPDQEPPPATNGKDATSEQIKIIKTQILRSHLLCPFEYYLFDLYVQKKLSLKSASEIIEQWLQKERPVRAQFEKQGGKYLDQYYEGKWRKWCEINPTLITSYNKWFDEEYPRIHEEIVASRKQAAAKKEEV